MNKILTFTFAYLIIGALQIVEADEPAAPAVSASEHAALMQWATERGFKQERGGKDRYCKAETPMGSRFEKKTCFTEAQLAQVKDKEPPSTIGVTPLSPAK